jgi:adenine-specific DNA-methyltransferase
MRLIYNGKKEKNAILETVKKSKLVKVEGDSINKLIWGENLKVLKTLIDDFDLKGKIDLVYIDPPFSTNNIFKLGDDRANTISSRETDKIAYKDNLRGEKFFEFLRERLIFLREVMSKKASIYLHIDYKIGHYIKLIMDEVFGINNFRSDISRIKCNPKNFERKNYGNIKDMILFYTKTDDYIWNEPREAFTEENIKKLFNKTDKDGRRYTTIPLHAPGETKNGITGREWRGIKPPAGRHWRCSPEKLECLDQDGLIEWSANGVPRKKIYADEQNGKRIQDIWEFKDPQYPTYPTEKNIDLLKLIISTSSNYNSIVLDCFCGSGTTLVACSQMGRNWIGIDESEQAINVTRKRLLSISDDLFSDSDFEFYIDEMFINKENFHLV